MPQLAQLPHPHFNHRPQMYGHQGHPAAGQWGGEMYPGHANGFGWGGHHPGIPPRFPRAAVHRFPVSAAQQSTPMSTLASPPPPPPGGDETGDSASDDAQPTKKNEIPGPADWPDSLKMYVQRAFSSVSDADKDEIQTGLKAKITDAFASGSALVTDWDIEPLPIPDRFKQRPWVMNAKPGSLASSVARMARGGRSARGGLTGSGRNILGGRRSRSRSRSISPTSRRYRRSRSRSPDSDGPSRFLSARLGEGAVRGKRKESWRGKRGSGLGYVESSKRMLSSRAARFGAHLGEISSTDITTALSQFKDKAGGADDWDHSSNITGTSTSLEKRYLRLTKAPDPSDIRPIEILRESLKMVRRHWLEHEHYFYCNEQLKCIRQDLTVQGIRNEFTVTVYETHARLALENGDHEEFNQCQSQLKSLYSEKINSSCRFEFESYRLIYYMFTDETMSLYTELSLLSDTSKEDACIQFALSLEHAWALNNYHQFFKLYHSAPKMSGYLMDWFADRIRKKALKAMIKAYRPNLCIARVKQELNFVNDEEMWKFFDSLPEHLTFADSKKQINCRASMTALPSL